MSITVWFHCEQGRAKPPGYPLRVLEAFATEGGNECVDASLLEPKGLGGINARKRVKSLFLILRALHFEILSRKNFS
jgi:hypothetical protein